MNEDKKIHIVTENVAIPEIIVGEEEENKEEKEEKGSIDFDVAIPEIHFNHKDNK